MLGKRKDYIVNFEKWHAEQDLTLSAGPGSWPLRARITITLDRDSNLVIGITSENDFKLETPPK